jgi:hypothetical protein
LRDQGTSSGGSAATGAPAWRGFPSSTRSISAQLGGPLNQPTLRVYSKICSISRAVVKAVVKRAFTF